MVLVGGAAGFGAVVIVLVGEFHVEDNPFVKPCGHGACCPHA